MKITNIGGGNMGLGIGSRAVEGGESVEIVDHDPAEAARLANELGESATALPLEAPFGGEVVVLAVGYPASRTRHVSTPIG